LNFECPENTKTTQKIEQISVNTGSYTQKVKYLKYGPGTDNPDWRFSCFLSFPPEKYLDKLLLPRFLILHLPPNILPSTIHYYTKCATECREVKK